MARLPGAVWRGVVNKTVGGMEGNKGLVLHVQQGNNSLFGWFNNPRSQASSHFWVSKQGLIEQYVDTADKSWAQRAGNPLWISVETEGYVDEPLNAAQLSALVELYIWGHKTFRWPLEVANDPDDKGFGWHGMGAPDWGHSVCPGSIRKAQRAEIIARARAILEPKAPTVRPYPGHLIQLGSDDHKNVRRIQAQLTLSGYKLIADGLFGPKTQSAVKRFQLREGLADDGIVGRLTWTKLFGG